MEAAAVGINIAEALLVTTYPDATVLVFTDGEDGAREILLEMFEQMLVVVETVETVFVGTYPAPSLAVFCVPLSFASRFSVSRLSPFLFSGGPLPLKCPKILLAGPGRRRSGLSGLRPLSSSFPRETFRHPCRVSIQRTPPAGKRWTCS